MDVAGAVEEVGVGGRGASGRVGILPRRCAIFHRGWSIVVSDPCHSYLVRPHNRHMYLIIWKATY